MTGHFTCVILFVSRSPWLNEGETGVVSFRHIKALSSSLLSVELLINFSQLSWICILSAMQKQDLVQFLLVAFAQNPSFLWSLAKVTTQQL